MTNDCLIHLENSLGLDRTYWSILDVLIYVHELIYKNVVFLFAFAVSEMLHFLLHSKNIRQHKCRLLDPSSCLPYMLEAHLSSSAFMPLWPLTLHCFRSMVICPKTFFYVVRPQLQECSLACLYTGTMATCLRSFCCFVDGGTWQLLVFDCYSFG